ncbi:MAG: TetR/AcrR family transcriptional regulator [Actinomycetia bacterium]|nr:TetR/AcrR family transcriptional regulator [Actinomycetes bacterium]MCH9702481.1 TetR/AcrR family transcriptional regulator [Actinomycetes bacterium]MCH9760235.1 TetR/AcrR family transcriptional regulator [Actinomycetes bacterium]
MPSDTKDRLTEAVLLSLREHGYAGTSMQDLLRDTGVSSSSMYHFFPGGKEQLVASAVRSAGLAAAEQIVDVLERHELIEAITIIFDASAAEMEGNSFRFGCPIGVPATEAPADSVAIREAVAEVFTAWAAAYETGLRRFGLRSEQATMLGRFIVTAYEGSVTLARATRTTQPYQDTKAIVISACSSAANATNS